MERLTYIVLVTVSCFVYVVALAFNYLSGSVGKDAGIFKSSTGDISDKYPINITPAGFTFSIWGLIYIWQTLWLIFAIVNIFRKTETGYAFNNPELMTVPFFAIFIFNMGLNLAWILLFDREYLEACLAVLFLMYVTLYICLFFSYRALDQNLYSLKKSERNVDIWLTRIFVQNGISMYATWCTIATNLNVAMVLTYRSSFYVSAQAAGTVALGIIAAQIILFVSLDFFALDKFTRYTWTPYCVIVFALIGSLSKNYSEGARNTIFTIVLLAIGTLLLAIKVILTFVRHFRTPLNGTKISDSKEDLKNQVV